MDPDGHWNPAGSEPPALERPDPDDDRRWRGPRGTSIDAWIRELERIIELLMERERRRTESASGHYKTDMVTRWRLDCLTDMLEVLRYNEGRI
jgi:hypothetical protein